MAKMGLVCMLAYSSSTAVYIREGLLAYSSGTRNDVLTLAHFPEIMMERGEGGLGVYHGSFDRLVVIVGTSVDFKSV